MVPFWTHARGRPTWRVVTQLYAAAAAAALVNRNSDGFTGHLFSYIILLCIVFWGLCASRIKQPLFWRHDASKNLPLFPVLHGVIWLCEYLCLPPPARLSITVAVVRKLLKSLPYIYTGPGDPVTEICIYTNARSEIIGFTWKINSLNQQPSDHVDFSKNLLYL